MRIVIDLQACQSEQKDRGIGRYSLALAKAMAEQRNQHEIRIVLNSLYPEEAKNVEEQFIDLLPPTAFSYCHYPDIGTPPLTGKSYQNLIAEKLVSYHCALLRADILHVSSVFDGLFESIVTPPAPAFSSGTLSSATLYDLIPLLWKETYLNDPLTNAWYHEKLGTLKKCDLLLAISEASRRDAIQHLGMPAENIFNISGAVDKQFKPINKNSFDTKDFLQRYGIYNKFILYTGGPDHRKNLIGAIDGYAILPLALRQQYQLVIVYACSSIDKLKLCHYAQKKGLVEKELIMTGFVSDENLVRLYNLCELFFFPSLYEGFGLPVLEAMSCGAPTLGANNSSMPEIIGRQDALFDAKNPQAIATSIENILSNDNLRQDLIEHGLKRAKLFTWQRSAKLALEAFEESYQREQPSNAIHVAKFLPRRKIAYFSPLPNQHSEIADYSAQLLPELARHFDIDLYTGEQKVTDAWLLNNFNIFLWKDFSTRHKEYDAVLYNFGNYPCHAYMYDLIQQYPGIVVLHDFFLGDLIRYIDTIKEKNFFASELIYSHGYSAVMQSQKSNNNFIDEELVNKFPCNRRILDAATGIIVHSPSFYELRDKFYHHGISAPFRCVQHLHRLEYLSEDKKPLRQLEEENHAYSASENNLAKIAAEYTIIIEEFIQREQSCNPNNLIKELAKVLMVDAPNDLQPIAIAALENKIAFHSLQILIDVSEVAKTDYGSGIQRVTKSLSRCLMKTSNTKINTNAVQLQKNKSLCQANKLLQKLGVSFLNDANINITPHSILLMLDSSWTFYDEFLSVFAEIRRKQGKIYTVVYDLIPICHPQFCATSMPAIFRQWLNSAISNSHGLICISKTVADILADYINNNKITHNDNLKIGYFHLGADLPVMHNKSVICTDLLAFLNYHPKSPTFLMVGTIEPRKGHGFTLNAFEQLWNKGIKAKLCIVGKKGWNVDNFISRIATHSELNHQLFWLESATDAEIIHCYQHTAGLIFASKEEGFGLPLVEAAQYGLPIICSDIPVFKEICNEHVTYFSLESPNHLTDTIEKWLLQSEHPDSSKISWLTWEQSTQQLLDVMLNNKWYKTLPKNSNLG